MNKLFAVLIILCSGVVYADDDRFGSERFEVPRASYTDTVDFQVLIASAPRLYENYGGEIYLKNVSCSGTTASIITFYDTVTFAPTTSTRTKVSHTGTEYTSIPYGILFSSGLMYAKSAGGPCTIQWDYTTKPRHTLRHY